MNLDEFPFAQVAAWLAEGSVIPFLGAGASRVGVTDDPCLPDGATLALELINQMGGAFPKSAHNELAKVAQFYEQTVFDRPALYDFINTRFEKEQQHAQLSTVAKLMAAVPNRYNPLFLMTTNYDLQIERAMHESHRPICVITQNMRDPENGASRVEVKYPDGSISKDDAVSFQWRDQERTPDANTVYLFKMHGSARPSSFSDHDDIIITEDDYVDFLINSGGPVTPFFPPPSLAAMYKTRRFLFLGYSLEDWNFRAFLRLLAVRNALSGRGQRRHWAIQLAPSPLDESLWGQRNVNLYQGDLSEFCQRLGQNWPGRVAS